MSTTFLGLLVLVLANTCPVRAFLPTTTLFYPTWHATVSSRISWGFFSRVPSFVLYASPKLQPLATEGDWAAYLDEEGTGLVYYFNGKTGQALWEKPTPTFPEVVLSRSMRRRAQEKQGQYIKAVEQQKEDSAAEAKKGNNNNNLFSVLLQEPEPQKKKEPEEWFKSLFDEKMVVPQEEEDKKSDNNNKRDDWFKSFLDEKVAPKLGDMTVQAPTSFFGKMFAKPDNKDNSATTSVVEAAAAKKGPSFFDKMFNQRESDKLASTTMDSYTTQDDFDFDLASLELTEVAEPPVVVKVPGKLEMSSFVLPHPAKVFWGGEDAVFTKGKSFGVFDGVSGAQKLDGIPLYSKTLAEHFKAGTGDQGLSVQDLTALLEGAVQVANKGATGASTAIVGSIDEQGVLRVLNVGDSTCIVIRNGKVISKSKERSHYFECPYQFSKDSPDRPRDGTKMNVELEKGDLILMASDGVFDNLFDDEVVNIVMSGPKPPSVIAKRVAQQSRKVSLNRDASTPYSKLAQKFGDRDYAEGVGGKVDDISCVVVRYE